MDGVNYMFARGVGTSCQCEPLLVRQARCDRDVDARARPGTQAPGLSADARSIGFHPNRRNGQAHVMGRLPVDPGIVHEVGAERHAGGRRQARAASGR